MPGSGAPLQPGSAQGSEGLVGATAWTGSGNRATDGWSDTSPEMAWGSWVEEACERRVWPHERRWWMKRKKKRREFWVRKIHEASPL